MLSWFGQFLGCRDFRMLMEVCFLTETVVNREDLLEILILAWQFVWLAALVYVRLVGVMAFAC